MKKFIELLAKPCFSVSIFFNSYEIVLFMQYENQLRIQGRISPANIQMSHTIFRKTKIKCNVPKRSISNGGQKLESKPFFLIRHLSNSIIGLLRPTAMLYTYDIFIFKLSSLFATNFFLFKFKFLRKKSAAFHSFIIFCFRLEPKKNFIKFQRGNSLQPRN